MDFEEYERLKGVDEKRTWNAVYIAVIFHLILFFAQYNVFQAKAIEKKKKDIFEVKKYIPPKPPEKKQQQKKIQRTVFKPIPDPTPDEPEIDVEEIPEDYWEPEEDFDDFVDYDDEDVMPTAQVMNEFEVSQPPEAVSKPQPKYPEIARAARVSGRVIAQIVVGTDGRVQSVKILRGIKGNFETFFNNEAIRALKQWKYKPAIHNGMPVPVRINVTLIFTLN